MALFLFYVFRDSPMKQNILAVYICIKVAVHDVNLNSKVEENLTDVLENLGLPVNMKPSSLPPDQAYNMITNYNLVDFGDAPKQQPQLVAWCPPLPNWNPWTACNIDEGPEVGFHKRLLVILKII